MSDPVLNRARSPSRAAPAAPSLRDALRAPWTVIFPGSVGAYREDCLDWALPTGVFGIGHDLSEMLTTLEAFWRASWSSLFGGKILASDLPSTLPSIGHAPTARRGHPPRARTRKITFELWSRTFSSWTQARQQPPD
jgi:hypothetical protein